MIIQNNPDWIQHMFFKECNCYQNTTGSSPFQYASNSRLQSLECAESYWKASPLGALSNRETSDNHRVKRTRSNENGSAQLVIVYRASAIFQSHIYRRIHRYIYRRHIYRFTENQKDKRRDRHTDFLKLVLAERIPKH